MLTAEGRHAFKRATPNVVRAIGTILGEKFNDQEIDELHSACDRIATAAEAMTT